MGHSIVVDLGFGDCGKGTVVDWLCGGEGRGGVVAVVRFNGGAQAGHNVITNDGRHHTFSQFGAGSFQPGVRTFLSRYMLVDPLALLSEAAHLELVGVRGVLGRLAVDREALVVTPYHKAANQARERARGDGRHGSCGMGIGETAKHALEWDEEAVRVGDLYEAGLVAKLDAIRMRVIAEFGETAFGVEGLVEVEDVVRAWKLFTRAVVTVGGEHLGKLLAMGDVVFEGAQGVLLDENLGLHPHTTWSTTTFANAEMLLSEAGRGGSAARIGVVRTYTTRHGAGPLVSEDENLTRELVERFNGSGEWQGAFRVGHFDGVAHRYAVEACGGVDGLAVTHLDVAERRGDLALVEEWLLESGEVVGALTYPGADQRDEQAALSAVIGGARGEAGAACRPTGAGEWVRAISDKLGADVWLESYGPRAADKVQTSKLLGC